MAPFKVNTFEIVTEVTNVRELKDKVATSIIVGQTAECEVTIATSERPIRINVPLSHSQTERIREIVIEAVQNALNGES